jgi:IS6 family transposase
MARSRDAVKIELPIRSVPPSAIRWLLIHSEPHSHTRTGITKSLEIKTGVSGFIAKFGNRTDRVKGAMPITVTNPFKGRQYLGDVILQAVRWYLRYPLAYEHVAELLAERGLEVDASCVWRWVQVYSPELNKRCQPHLKRTNKSYRVDETYIKVKGQDKYLYRAVDSTGQTIDFLLAAKRDTAAAKRFFEKVFSSSSNPIPRVINVDKNPAYPAAVEALKAEGTLPRRVRLRQCKYLNNVIEQDHRNVKKRTWLAKGYGSFQSAWRTLEGIETMSMIRKGRVRWVAKGDVVAEARFIAKLFAIAA